MPVPIELRPRRLDGFRGYLLITVGVVMVTIPCAAMADYFGPVRYDPKGDQLIVTVMYDGTNSHHHLSFRWGSCFTIDQPRAVGPNGRPLVQPPHQIELDILDDQGSDLAKKSYTKTITVPLADLSCRPARVTLLTEPAAITPYAAGTVTLDIP
jgi:hypothetical protein